MIVSPRSKAAIHRFVRRRRCKSRGIAGQSLSARTGRSEPSGSQVPQTDQLLMTPPATALPVEMPQAFLGVARSLTDKLWRDRLDARGAAKALAIVQQHQLPELLARVLAGRGVDIDAVRRLPRSDHPQAHAGSVHGDGDGSRREADRGCRREGREGRDLRRLRRRRRDLGGAARLASAPLRARSADPHSRPHL